MSNYCSSWLQQLGTTSTVCVTLGWARRLHQPWIAFFLALSVHVDFFYHFALGTLELLGQASKLFFLAPLRSLMDKFPAFLLRCWHALHCRPASSHTDGCLYITSLSLLQGPISLTSSLSLSSSWFSYIIFLIVFLHHLRHHHPPASVPAEPLFFSLLWLDLSLFKKLISFFFV